MTHDRDDSPTRDEVTEAQHGRGTLDPGLKEQFERDRTVVRARPSSTPEADALQRPHYEADNDEQLRGVTDTASGTIRR